MLFSNKWPGLLLVQASIALLLRTVQIDLDELTQLLACKVACGLMGRDRCGDSDNAVAGQNRANVGNEHIISRFMTAVVSLMLLDMQFSTEPIRKCLPCDNLDLIPACHQSLLNEIGYGRFARARQTREPEREAGTLICSARGPARPC